MAGQAQWAGPEASAKSGLGAEAGNGDWDGPGSRTTVWTLTEDVRVGAQHGQGSGELLAKLPRHSCGQQI